MLRNITLALKWSGLKISMEVTDQGHKYLFFVTEQTPFVQKFVINNVEGWMKSWINCSVSLFATHQTHTALAVTIHGLIEKWCYLFQVSTDLVQFSSPLKQMDHQVSHLSHLSPSVSIKASGAPSISSVTRVQQQFILFCISVVTVAAGAAMANTLFRSNN